MLIRRARDIQVPPANVVDSLVVNQEGTVRVLDGAVGRKNSIVGLDDSGAGTGGRVDGKLELALLAVVGRKTLEEKSSETGTSSTTERVED